MALAVSLCNTEKDVIEKDSRQEANSAFQAIALISEPAGSDRPSRFIWRVEQDIYTPLATGCAGQRLLLSCLAKIALR